MEKKYFIFLFLGIVFQTNSSFHLFQKDEIVPYFIDLKKDKMALYWKDEKGNLIGNFKNLKRHLKAKKKVLSFAMNAGMYDMSYNPQGLYIENGKILKEVDQNNGDGNFYLKPNGIFYWTNENIPFVCKTEDFVFSDKIKYATQSGPMLVIDGKIHPEFKSDSKNLNIRNGVGILPNHKIVFAISKSKINFYDFAKYFKDLGCKNALYLDGFVSRIYFPEKKITNLEEENFFGVLIGILK